LPRVTITIITTTITTTPEADPVPILPDFGPGRFERLLLLPIH
jgi:hypothetical protein